MVTGEDCAQTTWQPRYLGPGRYLPKHVFQTEIHHRLLPAFPRFLVMLTHFKECIIFTSIQEFFLSYITPMTVGKVKYR